mgnify:CR=1 FL=1
MSHPPIIEARHASLTYHTRRGPIPAVDDVSLAIAPGECVAILGRSGSGKSTLLALLGGLCAPTAGEVCFADRPWRARTPTEISVAGGGKLTVSTYGGVAVSTPSSKAKVVKTDIGAKNGVIHVIDNVLLPAVLAGKPRGTLAARAEELLELVGLADRWDAYPAELSGGQQRRVALARALAAEPAVILADEPTGDLDALAAGEITGIIVIVTHDPALAAIADRRLWMERGRCTALTDAATPPVAHAAAVPVPPGLSGAAVFEPAPADLSPLRPAIHEGSLARSWLPFIGGLTISAAAVAVFDGLIARKQDAVVHAARQERRLAEEMAMQDLRADIDDVVVDAHGKATVTAYLQNFRPERLLHVLGPAIEVGIQRDGRWDTASISVEKPSTAIRTIGSGKTLVPLTFSVPEERYDELLRGYLHVRIGAAMVVSDRPDGTGDLFERLDAYYIYLRDPRRTEDEIRRANGWGDKATVPLWIAMPSH